MRGLVATAAMVLLALQQGCAQPVVPRDHYYRLLATGAAPALERPLLGGTLLVKRFAADGVLGERPLIYAERNSPQALYQYSYHLWAEPPTRLLQDLTIDYLRARGVAGQVVTPAFRVDSEHVLLGRIRRLEHLRGETGAVTMSLELAVVRVRDERLLLLETYTESRPVASADVGAAIAALGDALSAIYARFVADLSRSSPP